MWQVYQDKAAGGEWWRKIQMLKSVSLLARWSFVISCFMLVVIFNGVRAQDDVTATETPPEPATEQVLTEIPESPPTETTVTAEPETGAVSATVEPVPT